MKTKNKNYADLYARVTELEKELRKLKRELSELENSIIAGDLPVPSGFQVVEVEGRVSPSYQSIVIHALASQPRNIVAGLIKKACSQGKISPREHEDFLAFVRAEWKKHHPPQRRKKVLPI